MKALRGFAGFPQAAIERGVNALLILPEALFEYSQCADSVFLVVLGQRFDAELAVFLDQLLDTLFGFLETLLAHPRQLDATLERGERFLERLLASLHFFDNLFEFGECLLEIRE